MHALCSRKDNWQQGAYVSSISSAFTKPDRTIEQTYPT